MLPIASRSSKSPLDRIQTVCKIHNLRQSIRTPGKQLNVRFDEGEKKGRTTAMRRKADSKFGGEKRDTDLHNLKQFLSLLGIF